jgi:hypothetical protein
MGRYQVMGSLLRLCGYTVLALVLAVGFLAIGCQFFGLQLDKSAFRDSLEARREKDELDQRSVAVHHWFDSRRLVARAVIDGRSNLSEAAEAYRRSDEELTWLAPAGEARSYRQVIDAVRGQLEETDQITARQDFLERLEREYRERFGPPPVTATP